VVSSTTAHKERLGRPKLHVFFSWFLSLFIFLPLSLHCWLLLLLPYVALSVAVHDGCGTVEKCVERW